jgi:hypothetical protein
MRNALSILIVTARKRVQRPLDAKWFIARVIFLIMAVNGEIRTGENDRIRKEAP